MTENSASCAVDTEQENQSFLTPTRSWTEVASAIWEKRRRAPKYPKGLTEFEIMAQWRTAVFDNDVLFMAQWRTAVFDNDVMARLTQLDSDKVFPILHQFETFVHKVVSITGLTPWPSWKHAWRDFAEYAGLNTLAHRTAMLQEGF